MIEVLGDYSFWTVAAGTMCLAVASSVIGTISVLTRQSLIGDSLGHASYPGVLLSFMVFQSRNPFLLMLGAMLSGYLSYALVRWMTKSARQSLVNALSLVSAGFFGLGMVLKQYLQGNAAYQGVAQAGLQTYLFGQAAFIQRDDVLLIFGVSMISLLLFLLYYQSFKLYLFDKAFAQVSGVKVAFLERMTTLLMIALIALGLKVVGAVLMSSFLIAPAVFGLLLGTSYRQALLLSAASAVLSAFCGTFISSLVAGLSTGPTMIVFLSLFAFGAFIWINLFSRGGKHG
ncbi:metal ABC transporter permease [Streptococcus plurextorum]|uniref:metal ABC transporter permease n=1 Tax=Streptococcus plurextorum TaxID=456876 RepID=UPI00040B6818|nr:iron chelate uptake ABC transporter family permease subunit [Streptococcus plurextorum]